MFSDTAGISAYKEQLLAAETELMQIGVAREQKQKLIAESEVQSENFKSFLKSEFNFEPTPKKRPLAKPHSPAFFNSGVTGSPFLPSPSLLTPGGRHKSLRNGLPRKQRLDSLVEHNE